MGVDNWRFMQAVANRGGRASRCHSRPRCVGRSPSFNVEHWVIGVLIQRQSSTSLRFTKQSEHTTWMSWHACCPFAIHSVRCSTWPCVVSAHAHASRRCHESGWSSHGQNYKSGVFQIGCSRGALTCQPCSRKLDIAGTFHESVARM